MIIVALVILGVCLGSFVNALVWRIHQQSLPRKKRAASDEDLSIATGRSMCTHCKHTLAWYDLLPLISWLSLAGKCRYCKQSIGLQYPLVEVFTASLFVLSYVFWPLELLSPNSYLLFSLWLMAFVAMMALIVYDLKWMLLPNRIVIPLIELGIATTIVRVLAADRPLIELLLSLGGLAVAGGIFYILFQFSDGGWIGGGDVKLGFALGLLLGSPTLAFLMLFMASILGLIVSLPGVITKKSKLNSKIPFGPFLIVATILVQLFGASVIDWYTATFLYL